MKLLLIRKLSLMKILGLANKKTVSIQAEGKDLSVALATTKTNKQKNPASLVHKTVMKKDFRRMAKAVTNQVIDKPFYFSNNFLLC